MFKYIVLIYFVFLSACNIENNYETRTDLSNDEIAKTLNLSNQTEDISKEWFSMFDDKDLNTLLNEAKKSNFTLAQSKKKLLQARYLFLINSNENLPTLDINSQYDFIKSNNSKDIYNNNDGADSGHGYDSDNKEKQCLIMCYRF
jgi:outer membrane protein TolC